MKKKGGGGGCLGAPMRALSRACDSACDLYVRGMSGCARGVPRGSSAGIVGRGFGGGGSGAATLRLRVSSDKADDDLVRAAAAAAAARRQRRVAAEPDTATAEAGKVGSAGGGLPVRAPARKRAAAATMGTIAEDAPCEFVGLDGGGGACAAPVPSLNPPRRGGFVAVKAGGDVFAR
jgi:hypothetical protein